MHVGSAVPDQSVKPLLLSFDRAECLVASRAKLPDQQDEADNLIDMDGEHIHSIFAVSNPDKLRTIRLTLQFSLNPGELR